MSEDQQERKVEQQSIDTALMTYGGLVPKNLEQLWRLAVIMSKSGMMPKGIQTPEAVCVAVQMGLEIGLRPMQSVQNIAVINGRPSVWGDVGLALVEASGQMEDFKETIEEANGFITATCWAKRKDHPTPVERTFTTADAKQAGLHGKEGPWRQYPKRMTQMRARWWVIRDLFPDILKGLKAAEEVQDYIDVTPEPKRTLKIEEETAAETAADPYAVQNGKPQGKEDAPGPGDPVEVPTGPPEGKRRGRPPKDKAPEPPPEPQGKAVEQPEAPAEGQGQGEDEPPPFDPPETPNTQGTATPREFFHELVQEIGLPTTIRILRNGFDIKRVEDVTDKQLSMVIDRMLVEKERTTK